MTNRLALILAGLILTGLLLDQFLHAGVALALARRFVEMIEWLMFWR